MVASPRGTRCRRGLIHGPGTPQRVVSAFATPARPLDSIAPRLTSAVSSSQLPAEPSYRRPFRPLPPQTVAAQPAPCPRRNGSVWRLHWYGYVKAHLPKSANVKQEDIDWKEFLGNAPERPFPPNVLTGWYGYLDYTDGPVTNLGCHFIDLYSYITGGAVPRQLRLQRRHLHLEGRIPFHVPRPR